jgi:hypothetical protein
VQTYLSNGVKEERSGWRDMDLSRRHRKWGFNAPIVDIDFLVIEYNRAKPMAMVEYKLSGAPIPDIKSASYRALLDLANNYGKTGIPFLISVYRKCPWMFKIIPVNDLAKNLFAHNEELSEKEYVSRLYDIRGMSLEKYLKHEEGPSVELDNISPELDKGWGWMGKRGRL